jgi:benzoate-CoA ligase family protein
MERARVNGTELEYEIRGEGEPVLLIHGSHIGGSFVPLMAQPSLTDEYKLIRYHRRGFLGSSPAEGPMSIKEQADDARALLEHLGLRPAHVVAHSYGGPIALQLALDAPEYVHSLALLEPAVLSVPRGKMVHDLVAVATRHYEQGEWDVAEDFFLGSPKERVDISRNVPGGLEQALADMDTYFAVEVPAHVEWQFDAAEGWKIKQPALYMLGGESSSLYVEVHDTIRQWMPQMETVVLPGATHLLHIQEPGGAAVLLRNFFARHPITPHTAGLGGPAAHKAQPADRYNATSDLLDGNLERGLAEKVAIRTYSGAWTYADVASAANRVGNALRGLGVEMENRVLVALPDSPEFAATFFGAIKIGAVPIPVNTSLQPLNYAYMLDDSRAKVAVVSESVAEAFHTARRRTSYVRHLVVLGNTRRDELSFEQITHDADEDLSPADTTRDDVCFWLYTSGTTGRPKGVVHLQHYMRFCADTYARHVLRIDESDTTFSVSRLYFAYGLGGGLYFPYSAGATTVLLAEPPQPRVVLNAMQEFRPTIFFGVPTSYAGLLAAGPSTWKRADFGSVRVCVSAGEALSGSLLKRWKENTGLEILDGIGSTESCHIFISNRMGDVRPNCTGRVVEGWEARVVDDDGREVPAGESGMLMVKGDSNCPYYWNDHDLTKETIRGEWLRTGDTFVEDESGYFYYQGRVDEMLKVGGMWVSPLEVEAVLNEHERVVESAVVGVRDSDEARGVRRAQ